MSEEPTTTPRINKALLPKYVGRTVRLVGRVTGKRGGEVEVQTSDGGSVTVRTSSGLDDYDAGMICEIIGKVHEDLTLEEYNMSVWNADFNMDNFNQLVRLVH